ncbi:MAG: YncE family protein [Bacteroidaceae bacterium]|nr:YncE family protein [Bacteroidaceae bacterium]
MRKRTTYPLLLLLLTALLMLAGCHQEEPIIPSVKTQVTAPEVLPRTKGFFLLNEGNMGSNKCTLDFFDYASGTYYRNIYAERNPGVVQELGDVGNDLAVYGSKLYAVVNCSHFVEVMDVRSARHLGQVSIPNCRSIVFEGRYAYVSSYAGPVRIDPNARLGYVARIDTATLQITDTCTVGYQPEEMAIANGKLYVANSGGYRVPNYDTTVSVIDLSTFKREKDIDVAVNLHRMVLDEKRSQLFVSSRGDYGQTPSGIYVIDTRADKVTGSIPLSCSSMTLAGDSLYVVSAEWNAAKASYQTTYAIYDVARQQVLPRPFIADGTETSIDKPYGLAVNPDNGDILVTDAADYITPGTLRCYSPQGKLRWSVTTGDIPSKIAFTTKSFILQ